MEQKIKRIPNKEISVFILNGKHEVLLQKRSANKKFHPNKWALLHGHVEPKETIEHAALREIKEELGIEAKLADLHIFADGKFNIIEQNFDSTYFFYTKCNLQAKDFTIQQEELSEVKWFNIEEIIKMLKNQDKTLVYKENKLPLFEYLKNIE